MLNNAWVAFLRHLPPALQQGLAIKTLGGTEVSISMILRIDHEFFALKGRLSGTQDAGRVFFMPYNQIDHFYYQQEIKEADFIEAFSSLKMPVPNASVGAIPEPEPEPVAAAAPEPVPEPENDSTPVNRPTPVPIKSAVLKRFRARSMSPGGSSPGGRSSSPG